MLSAHSTYATFAPNQDDHLLAENIVNDVSAAVSDDPSAYIIPHPPNFVSPCSLCEEFGHNTLEHGSCRSVARAVTNHYRPYFCLSLACFSSTQQPLILYPLVARLSHLDAAYDRALLEDISAAVDRLPISPEVAVAGTVAKLRVLSVMHNC